MRERSRDRLRSRRAAISDRSARRHTVRATCASAAARVPPGRMNSLSGARSALKRSTRLRRARRARRSSRRNPGIDNSPPRSNEIVLYVDEACGNRLAGSVFGEQHADDRIEFVDAADRLDARRILRYARAVAQAGRAGIAGARHDLRQAMPHGCADWKRWKIARVAKSARRGKRTRAGRAFASMDSGSAHRRRTLRMNPYEQRSRPQRRQLCAADAAVVPRAHGVHLAASRRRHSRRAPLHVAGNLRALATPRVRACRAWHRQGRHRRGDARQHAGDDRGTFRRADDAAACSTRSTRASTPRRLRSCSTTARPRCC